MSPKVAVIGSNSFSGSWFADYLLSLGIDVIGISRSAEPLDVFLPYRWQKRSGRFEFHQLDLNRDLERICNLIGDCKPQYVVNFAAQGMVAQSWEKPGDWFATNTLANVNLHDRLRKFPFLRRYVHISTPEVYGTCSGVVSESTHYNPSTPYAVSRAAADLSLMSFFRAYKFPVIFTRAANVYGPGQQLYRIIPRTMMCALTGTKLQLHGGGHSVRSFIHIRDVVKGTWLAAERGEPGQIYHLATGSNVSIRSVVESTLKLLNMKFEDCVEAAEERLGKDEAYLLGTAKIRALGWSDQEKFEDGLRETAEWVRANLAVLKTAPQDYVHKP